MQSERCLQLESIDDAGLVGAALADERSPDREPTADEHARRERALRLLILRHTRPLQRWLLARLGSPALVDDVVQDVWIIVWRALHNLENRGAFRSWLRQVAVHAALKHARRNRRHTLHETELLDLDGAADPADAERSPDRLLQRRAVVERIRRAIDELPPDYRDVMRMRYVHARACAEIAHQLGLSIQAVHKRLSRGRDQVGAQLAPEIGSLAALGAAGAAARTPEALADAVLCAVRRRPRPPSQPGRAARTAGAAGAAGLLAGWRFVAAALAALLGVLGPAAGGVLWAARAVRDAVDATSPAAALPSPPVRHWPSAAPRQPRPQLPDPADARADPGDAARFVDDGTRAPDYVVRSESTQIDSAIFGAHELRPMDAYGRELYEPVSKAFVMHVALCMWKSVLVPDERPRIELDLRFSLWPDLDGSAYRRRDAAMAQEHDVSYRLAGIELSSSRTIAFTTCLQEAFDNTGYPEPHSGAPRVIQHHIVIDFCVLAATFQLLVAEADAQARR